MIEEGKRIIDDKIEITITYLKNNYPEFKEFQTPNKKDNASDVSDKDDITEIEEVTNELYSKVDDYHELIEDLILKKLFEMAQDSTTKEKEIFLKIYQ